MRMRARQIDFRVRVGEGQSVGGWPSDNDARKSIEALVADFSWTYQETEGGHSHPVGALLCSERSRLGCRINVYGTGHNTARKLWRAAKRCSHGCAPNRSQW